MEFLSEDPTYLVGGLGVVAGAFLIASRVTQPGKYLIWAGVAFALAVAVFGVERFWVTDNERIERVVYDLGRAVAASDAPAALALMTDDVRYVAGGVATPGGATRSMVEETVSDARFDFLRITHLEANAGGQSRRGTAEFRVFAGGSFHGPYPMQGSGTSQSTWSLGFRETSPGVWKVNRISPLQPPGGLTVPLVVPTPRRARNVTPPPPDLPSGLGSGRGGMIGRSRSR